MEAEAGDKKRGWTRGGQTPQGMTGTRAKVDEGKGGGRTFMITPVDAGTWRGVQRRAAEAGGWRVREASRWAAICAGRGGGERVQNIVDFDNELLHMGGQ